MSDATRVLLNDQREPPEGIDPKSLRWVADYVLAFAEDVADTGRNATELHGLVHVLRQHARTREMADTCCAWCRKLPPLLARCPKRPESRKGRWCASAKDVRDLPGCYSRAENEATAENIRKQQKGLDQ